MKHAPATLYGMKTNPRNYLFVAAFVLLTACPAYGDEALVHKQIGDDFLRHGQTHSAIREYQKAVESNPNLSAVYFNMAIAYYSETNLKSAGATLEKVIELKPNDTEALYNLACIKLYLRSLEQAKFCFQKACCCTGGKNDFKTKSQNALDSIRAIEKMEPLMQNAFFAILQKNLPVLARS